MYDNFVHFLNTSRNQRSTDDMESMNDEEDGDFISSCEENQSQPRVHVASLEKLVDYCAEEFSKLHVAFAFVFFFTPPLLGDLFVFHNSLGNRSRQACFRSFCFS